MTPEDRNALYKKALVKWGSSLQICVLFEECAELIRAVSRFLARDGSVDAVIEECADVSIMVEQIILMFNREDEFEAVKEAKLQRLAEMLEGK